MTGKHDFLAAQNRAWTLSIILWLVGYWWFAFMQASIDSWHVSPLLFILLYGATIYFLIALIYPERHRAGTCVCRSRSSICAVAMWPPGSNQPRVDES